MTTLSKLSKKVTAKALAKNKQKGLKNVSEVVGDAEKKAQLRDDIKKAARYKHMRDSAIERAEKSPRASQKARAAYLKGKRFLEDTDFDLDKMADKADVFVGEALESPRKAWKKTKETASDVSKHVHRNKGKYALGAAAAGAVALDSSNKKEGINEYIKRLKKKDPEDLTDNERRILKQLRG